MISKDELRGGFYYYTAKLRETRNPIKRYFIRKKLRSIYKLINK